MTPARQVRAHFDEKTVRVYQAFSPDIVSAAVAAQRFVPPFGVGRMTWIKPSFTWMMYRSGWAQKAGQERVVRVGMTRQGFESTLAQSCLTSFDGRVHQSPEHWRAMLDASPVRIQWDPERTVDLQELPWRTVQIGLGREVVPAYVEEWIVSIEDVTPLARQVQAAVLQRDPALARTLLPEERPYPLSAELAHRIGCT